MDQKIAHQKITRVTLECPEDMDQTYQGIRQMMSEQLKRYFQAHAGDEAIRHLYDCVIREVEMALIENTLDFVEGNQSRASEILGLNRNTLRKKMQAYTIKGARARTTRSPQKR